jgi:phosphodiesterase/alkaline phosphatase D-like protein
MALLKSCCYYGALVSLFWLLFLATLLSVHFFWPEPPLSRVALLGSMQSHSAVLWTRAADCKSTIVEYTRLADAAHDGAQSCFPAKVLRSPRAMLTSQDEFVAAITLPELEPETRYAARFVWEGCQGPGSETVEHSGTLNFTTFPARRVLVSAPQDNNNAAVSGQGAVGGPTAQGVGAAAKASSVKPFSFFFASCSTVTMWPYDELWMIKHALNLVDMDFAMLLGDLTYTDIHQSLPLRIPFARAHKHILNDRHYQALFQRVPGFFMFDDHEVENDFEGAHHPLAEGGLCACVRACVRAWANG